VFFEDKVFGREDNEMNILRGKMMRLRKIWAFNLLLVATLFAGTASATLYLPDSSYEDGAWQGNRIYEEDGFSVLVEFSVYDTDNLQFAEETALAEQLGLAGQYIYAYQIFNHVDDIYEEVAYFGILDSEGEQISEAAIMGDTTCHDDGSGGVAPTPEDSETQGTWVWTFDGGYVSAGEHSWFLVYSSDYAPVVGDFEIRAHEEEGDLPAPVPEPAMIVLLGVGGMIVVSTKRR
jgi:hypothetical protein